MITLKVEQIKPKAFQQSYASLMMDPSVAVAQRWQLAAAADEIKKAAKRASDLMLAVIEKYNAFVPELERRKTSLNSELLPKEKAAAFLSEIAQIEQQPVKLDLSPVVLGDKTTITAMDMLMLRGIVKQAKPSQPVRNGKE